SLVRAGVDRIPAPAVPASTMRPEPAAGAAAGSGPAAAAARPVVETTIGTPPPKPRTAAAAPAQPPRLPSAPPPRTSSLFGDEAMESPVVDPAERPTQLAALQAEVAGCQRCPHLAATRTQTVFGTGSPTARLMFVGEAPGAEEDRTGVPFVGRAGQLL